MFLGKTFTNKQEERLFAEQMVDFLKSNINNFDMKLQKAIIIPGLTEWSYTWGSSNFAPKLKLLIDNIKSNKKSKTNDSYEKIKSMLSVCILVLISFGLLFGNIFGNQPKPVTSYVPNQSMVEYMNKERENLLNSYTYENYSVADKLSIFTGIKTQKMMEDINSTLSKDISFLQYYKLKDIYKVKGEEGLLDILKLKKDVDGKIISSKAVSGEESMEE